MILWIWVCLLLNPFDYEFVRQIEKKTLQNRTILVNRKKSNGFWKKTRNAQYNHSPLFIIIPIQSTPDVRVSSYRVSLLIYSIIKRKNTLFVFNIFQYKKAFYVWKPMWKKNCWNIVYWNIEIGNKRNLKLSSHSISLYWSKIVIELRF